MPSWLPDSILLQRFPLCCLAGPMTSQDGLISNIHKKNTVTCSGIPISTHPTPILLTMHSNFMRVTSQRLRLSRVARLRMSSSENSLYPTCSLQQIRHRPLSGRNMLTIFSRRSQKLSRLAHSSGTSTANSVPGPCPPSRLMLAFNGN